MNNVLIYFTIKVVELVDTIVLETILVISKGSSPFFDNYMSTINQVCRYNRKKKQRGSKVPALKSCPQKKGVCLKILERSPKKPNSASRKLALIRLSNNKRIYAYVPGIEYQPSLQEHSVVLVRGGRVKDLPGIKYKLIRGVYDFMSMDPIHRKSARSKYGTKLLK